METQLQHLDSFKFVKPYVRQYGLIRHQFDSFNNFVTTGIRDVICGLEPISVTKETHATKGNKTIRLTFGETFLQKPTIENHSGLSVKLFPREALLRSMTYSGSLYADIRKDIIVREPGQQPIVETVYYRRTYLGQIPIMVKSAFCNLRGVTGFDAQKLHRECPYNTGGYFIINGQEKVIVSQEIPCPSRILVFDQRRQMAVPYEYVVTLRPSTVFQIGITKNGIALATMRCLRKDIPVSILLKAFGVSTDKEILSAIGGNHPQYGEDIMRLFLPTLEESFSSATTQEEARQYITGCLRRVETNRRNQRQSQLSVDDFLGKSLLPHINQEDEKIQTIAYMTERLMLAKLNESENNPFCDDRDNYANKRIEVSGNLLMIIFRRTVWRMMRETQQLLEEQWKKDFGIEAIIKPIILTKALAACISTGNWMHRTSPVGSQQSLAGISQQLNRLNTNATLSHLRRLVLSSNRDAKAQVRQIHGSEFGFIDPCETPEGAPCGLLKNFASMAIVTVSIGEQLVKAACLEMIETTGENMLDTNGHMKARVFFNGQWLGLIQNVNRFISTVRLYRRQLKFPFSTSVSYDCILHEVHVSTDIGRLCRPVFIVHNGDIVAKKTDIGKNWHDLLSNGIIEYLDAEEQQTCMIAPGIGEFYSEPLSERQSYTHCEIDPSLILGCISGTIPFPDHNQAPRNSYECNMAKQSAGMSSLNREFRMMDEIVLDYPQMPLVTTDMYETCNIGALPCGTSAIVAIMADGFNQEDSVILNQSALDRGMFRITKYVIYTAEQKVSTMMGECIEKPNPANCDLKPMLNYSKLDDDGIICPGEHVRQGDVLVGKTAPVCEFNIEPSDERVDYSLVYRKTEPGMVESVVLTSTNKAVKVVRVKIRLVRIPQIGDKFASTHAQKGVQGCSKRQEDLPFTRDGLVPDIIINPHAIPSRMTIGHLLETLVGKTAAVVGKGFDGTPFRHVDTEQYGILLHQKGFQRKGEEVFYDGKTGKRFHGTVFVGVAYYQRLKHMVADKMHSRSRGPIQKLTRQPMEGRSRDGGLRFGEMERDCMISHGASSFIQERLHLMSDPFHVYICPQCGLIQFLNAKTGRNICRSCMGIDGTGPAMRKVAMPYAFKLLTQELMAMSIVPRCRLTAA